MGPTFGRTDIRIDTHKVVASSSSSHLGTSYSAPNEVKDNSTILAGANSFDPDELEVFYIQWLLKDSERSSVAEQSAEVCCSSSAPEDSKAPVQLFGHASFAEQSESRSRCSSSAPGDPKAPVKLLIRPCLVCRTCKYPTGLPTTSCSFELFDSDFVQLLDRSACKHKTQMPRETKGGGAHFLIGELEQRKRRRQSKQQKFKRLRLAKQQLCTRITIFCTFLSRCCTTTTYLLWRTREQMRTIFFFLLFLFPNLDTVA